jgi:hypothetical protein
LTFGEWIIVENKKLIIFHVLNTQQMTRDDLPGEQSEINYNLDLELHDKRKSN